MITWLKRFFLDETAFVGFVRACCIGVGTAVSSGLLTLPPSLVSGETLKATGVVLAGLGGFIRAGEKNPK